PLAPGPYYRETRYYTGMIVEMRAVAPFHKNGFVLACDDTREAVLIDPGDEVGDLLAIVAERRLTVRHILLTHGHVDHVAGVRRATEALHVPIHLHRQELPIYAAAVQQGLFFGLAIDQPPPVDCYYDEGSPIVFGGCEARARHTPGHTPGGVCLDVRKRGEAGTVLMVGDTLFSGSIGRTDLPGGDYETLIRSIRDVLFAFGDETVVYPGHGESTTIGKERRTNPFLITQTNS
ncbi:MAG: MBL fold metallo-hydrolase, partial [Acidobacteria bacterium]|nr:MBL fold metallo-hydrolase [Acidobacteriota bacterium]